jgi:predicted nucleotidyltransferase component of viral defense system
MKIWALLSRQKARDFFDVIYLLGLTKPDFQFLSEKLRINNLTELKSALANLLQTVNLKNKSRVFEHLLFNEVKKNQILYFENFIHELN